VVKQSEFGTRSFSTTPDAEAFSATGILGGTFDPVHLGHISAARQLQSGAALAEVCLMPNAQPPHRSRPPVASAADRLAMVELATAGIPGVCASAVEVERGGISYTIDTLRRLRAAKREQPVTLLLGSDAALQIGSWHQAEALLREASFLIFNRAEVVLDAGELQRLGFPAQRTRVLSIKTPAISARMVRERLGRGEPVDGLLAPGVAAYIRDRGLYLPSKRMG
jgi:nicotinate-nucleotide adenylyltransferase